MITAMITVSLRVVLCDDNVDVAIAAVLVDDKLICWA